MQLPICPIVGAITVEPACGNDARWLPATDDSSLESLLASLAQLPVLSDTSEDVRLVASTRWTCSLDEPAAEESIRADLARLLADLQSEYDQLAGQLHL